MSNVVQFIVQCWFIFVGTGENMHSIEQPCSLFLTWLSTFLTVAVTLMAEQCCANIVIMVEQHCSQYCSQGTYSATLFTILFTRYSAKLLTILLTRYSATLLTMLLTRYSATLLTILLTRYSATLLTTLLIIMLTRYSATVLTILLTRYYATLLKYCWQGSEGAVQCNIVANIVMMMFFELFLLRKYLSSQAGLEPTTFWSPVRAIFSDIFWYFSE